MAVDTFLKLEGIDGEAADAAHTDEIEVLSWAWGVINSGSAAVGGGGGSGKADFNDFTVTKFCDKASPVMMIHCATGKHIPTALLTCRKAGGEQLEYVKLEFTDLLVSSYQVGGAGEGGETPTETVGLSFSTVNYAYTPQLADV